MSDDERVIVAIGDIHGEHWRLGEALALIADQPTPALALLAGDLVRDPAHAFHGRSAELVELVAATLGCPVAYVPGNHDLPDRSAHPAEHNADDRRLQLAGLDVAGLGGAGPARFGFPYEWDEEQAARRLARLLEGDRADVLLSHTPPLRTLDRTARGAAVGSDAVRAAIEAHRPRLVVVGHIHEAHGVAQLGQSVVLNAGSLGLPYAETQIWRVAWNQGPSWIDRHDRDGKARVWARRGE